MSTAAVIGVCCFAAMIVLSLVGCPIALSLFASASVGFYLIGGDKMLMSQLTNGIFTLSASYNFAVVPLFTIVGILAGETGIAGGIYDCAKKWVGRQRGGLLYTTVVANAIFGACSGISTSANAVFAKVAMPELKKADYDESLSLGCIASAGTLSSLIPPSIPIITTAIMAELSIGTSLVCGLTAGVILTVLMCVLILIIALVKPGKVPVATEEDKAVTWKQRLVTLKLLLPVLGLFLLIVGGSFLGWFPATVGGCVATLAVVIYALCRRMPVKRIAKGVWNGAALFANIYLMIMAGNFFSRFVTVTQLAKNLITLITTLNIAPFLIFFLVVAFFLVVGCFMSVMTVLIIAIPIIMPVMMGLGFNGYVLCVVFVLLCELGNITPPVGNGVFTTAIVLGESPAKVFRGVLPFFLAELVLCLLFGLCPEILLFIPRLLGVGV